MKVREVGTQMRAGAGCEAAPCPATAGAWISTGLAVAVWTAAALAGTGWAGFASAQAVPASGHVQGQAQQARSEIDDAQTGSRWLLLPDSIHPGGPGRMVLAGSRETAGLLSVKGGNPAADASAIRPPARAVIRGGDQLIVEENSKVVEARFEAVALGPAAVGSVFEARLKIGGKPVRVVALGPGRAALAPESLETQVEMRQTEPPEIEVLR